MTTTIKYSITALLAIALLGTASIASAEEVTNTASVDVRARAEVHTDLRVNLEAKQQEAKARLEAAKEAAEAKRLEVQANIGTTRTEIQTTRDARNVEIKANIELKRTEFKENAEEREEMREERRAEIKENIATKTEARAQLHLERFTGILDAAIERLYGIIDRITVRADAMAENGADVSVAREHLDLAVSELVAAETALGSIEADLEASLSLEGSELTRETLAKIFANTKATIEKAKEHVRAAHQAVKNAVTALKVAASASVEVDASI